MIIVKDSFWQNFMNLGYGLWCVPKFCQNWLIWFDQLSKVDFFRPLDKNVRSKNIFGKNQYKNTLQTAYFIQFGPGTTKKSLSESAAKLHCKYD